MPLVLFSWEFVASDHNCDQYERHHGPRQNKRKNIENRNASLESAFSPVVSLTARVGKVLEKLESHPQQSKHRRAANTIENIQESKEIIFVQLTRR